MMRTCGDSPLGASHPSSLTFFGRHSCIPTGRRAVAPRLRIVLAATALLVACGGGAKDSTPTVPTPPPPVLTTVTVSLSATTIQVGQSASASASGADQSGAPIGTGVIAWSSDLPAVATVNSGGAIAAVGAGRTAIIATAGGRTGQQVLTVIPVPVATVTVTPAGVSLAVGASQQLSATTLDASGGILTGRQVVWTTTDSTRVRVSPTGVATAITAGIATVIATSEGKTGSASVTVILAPVASVTLTPSTATLVAGATLNLTANALDAAGTVLPGRVFTWTTSNSAIVSGAVNGNLATVTAVSFGTATITATSEGRSATSIITVATSAQDCSSATALQLAVGQAVALTAAQKTSLCLSAGSGSEYVLIPFNNSTIPSSVVSVTLTGTGTSASIAPPLVSRQPTRMQARLSQPLRLPSDSWEWAFRQSELRDLVTASERVTGLTRHPGSLTAIPASPSIGSIVLLNANGSGNLCTSDKQLHPARVVAVLPHTIVFIDTLAPAGGYTTEELTAFGTSFDTLGYGVDTLNFGAPTDIDGNNRVALFFTQGVNQRPQPQGGYVGGYFASRDLYAATASGCIGSNEGEIFYLPVPDPGGSINSNYRNRASLSAGVLGTLVHEFQHLINAGRRLYVNTGAVSSEEVWLNEGLSHVAEELLYYRVSGNRPRANIGLALLQSTQAQLDAVNTFQIQNFSRLLTYARAPEVNAPYAQNDEFATRGAIWQFLRYAADRLGGTERNTWYALVNATTNGQANFNAVFGSITTMARDWAVAQFMDDTGLSTVSNYSHPSWNYRSILPALNSGAWPLQTRSLLSSPISVSLSGGGAAYIRFRIAEAGLATVFATSSGQPVPSSVDFILVRTQ